MRNEAEVEVLVVTRSRTPTSSELDSFMDALQYTLYVDYNLHLRMYEHVRMSRNSNDDKESETATHFSPTP